MKALVIILTTLLILAGGAVFAAISLYPELLAEAELRVHMAAGSAKFGSCIPTVSNNGIFKEITGEKVPLGRPVGIAPQVRLLCRFGPSKVLFHMNAAGEAKAVATIKPRISGPVSLEMQSGSLGISSEKIDVIWRLPFLELAISSASKATITIEKSSEFYRLFVPVGKVAVAITKVPGSPGQLPLRFQTTEHSSFETEGLKLAGNEIGDLLPSGLSKLAEPPPNPSAGLAAPPPGASPQMVQPQQQPSP